MKNTDKAALSLQLSEPIKPLEIEVTPIYRTFLMTIILKPSIVKNLNKYLDDLEKSSKKKSYAPHLAGQIKEHKKSGQWSMDPQHPLVREFTDIIILMANAYREHYLKLVTVQEPQSVSKIDSMWSVHSYEGDYNLLHTHLCSTLRGVSIVTWTKVPDAISKLPRGGVTNNASGNRDGFLEFIGSGGDSTDSERLKFSGNTTYKPAVGHVVAVPSWLPHCVWPFFGKGERRTIATNINMYKKDQIIWSSDKPQAKGYIAPLGDTFRSERALIEDKMREENRLKGYEPSGFKKKKT